MERIQVTQKRWRTAMWKKQSKDGRDDGVQAPEREYRSFRSEGGIPYKSWGKSYKKIQQDMLSAKMA